VREITDYQMLSVDEQSRSDTAPKLAAELWVHLDLRIPGYCRTGLDLFGRDDHLLKEIRCIDALA
jgi:hypothetical protein